MSIKRLLLLGLILILYFPFAFSQEKSKPFDESNLYYRALFASLDKMSKTWGYINDADSENIMRTDYRNMIVEKNPDITENLPTQLGEYRVEYLDAQGLIDRYKKLRKEFSILIPHPMKIEGARLKISLTVHWFSYKKRVLSYAISDWSNVYFRYVCEKGEYVIDEVMLGGI